MVVAFDTCVLAWGIQGKASAGFEPKVKQTRALLQRLAAENTRIIVPSPVAFELLLRVHPEMHGAALSELQKRFLIMPYDVPAAAKNAELWAKKAGNRQQRSEIRTRWPEATKAELRFDCQIVAIAALHKADVLYSEDPDVRAFAEGVIKVASVPESVEQARLF